MLINQPILFKVVNNGEKSGHSSSLPVSLNSSIVGMGKLPFPALFQLTEEEGLAAWEQSVTQR